MKVSSHAAVEHAITGVHLEAVFWQGHVPQWQGSRSYGGCHTLQQAGQHTGVPGICIICLPVTWRHQSGHQFVHESEGLWDQCCKFWQEWWSKSDISIGAPQVMGAWH